MSESDQPDQGSVPTPDSQAPEGGAHDLSDHDASELTSTISISPHEPDNEPGLHDPEQAAADALPPGSALLVVRKGPDAGSRFVLEDDVITAGRHPDSDIFLDDVTVSRRHAQFVRVDGRFEVKDVGSLNGTYVNRERIDQTGLKGHDEVQIGKYRLVFLVAPEQQSPAGGREAAQ